jgi:hypothetical protein
MLHPSVEITLDGKTYKLVFDFNAQAVFEEVTGTPLWDLFDKKGRLKISSRFTRALLFCQLLHHDPKVQFDDFGRITEPPQLSMRQVGNLITRDTMAEVQKKTAEALLLFFKPAKTEGEGEKNADPPSR